MMKTHYDTLGVAKSASTDDIKRAYRRLIRQYHPDRGVYDAQKVLALNQAYEILKDPQKRHAYDEMIAHRELGEQFWGLFDKAHRTVRQTVKNNAEFFRNLKPQNHDDHVVQWVHPWQAIFGDKVAIRTRHHHLMIAMPAFEKGLTMTIKGAGKPKADGSHGNLTVEFKIKVPNANDLSNEQKQALKQLFK